MPEKFNSILKFQNLRICLICYSVVHAIVFIIIKIFIFILFIHPWFIDIIILLFFWLNLWLFRFLKIWIFFIIGINNQKIFFWFFCFIYILKFTGNNIFFLIKDIYYIISWNPSNKCFLFINICVILLIVSFYCIITITKSFFHKYMLTLFQSHFNFLNFILFFCYLVFHCQHLSF